jgi:Mn-containing catalase
MCFARVLSLVAHYEAGMDYHLDVQLRSTYKFLIKMNELQNVQREMIRFLRSLGSLYPSELKDAFKKLYKEFKKYENDPYEKRAFLYLDVLSWLESKINNEPISESIRKKSIELNR